MFAIDMENPNLEAISFVHSKRPNYTNDLTAKNITCIIEDLHLTVLLALHMYYSMNR